MKHLDLFSGIGGFALATEMVWNNVEHIFCDNEPFSQAILKKHWPTSQIYGDIRTLTNTRGGEQRGVSGVGRQKIFEAGGIYILTGGFPCQPFSQAGRRKGTADDRFLWGEMFRVIREFKPRWVIGENVAGLLSIQQGVVFEQVCADLEGEGYAVQAFVIPAVAVNAPHRRDRVWIIANTRHGNDAGQPLAGERSKETGRGDNREPQQPASDGGARVNTNPSNTGLQRGRKNRTRPSRQFSGDGSYERPDWNQNWIEVATRLCTVDDGLPNGLARPRGWRNAALKGAGNAIVPQVAAEIMRAIKQVDL